ncbi:MAG: HAD hydrolase family protein [Gammaproteobacteria bacterium]|nr:HAD hydrolase family protein [Gammaproteobacteria bacterium]
MNNYFRAIAVDFDGTLTAESDMASESALLAIAEVRRRGLQALLVTGRILTELRQVFPSVDQWFDGIVAENGAVFCADGNETLLSSPVEPELDRALVEAAVPFRRGRILLASQVAFEPEIQAQIRRLGLECQLVRNRAELMILPPGVSKGFGVSRALESLGISHHNTIAIGDAENDHSLLSICEIGVAVANAVDGLKRHADVVLQESNGEGVANFIRHSVLATDVPLHPLHWQIELGQLDSGELVSIAASQINILITGRSKSGKSYVAGALAERLIEQGYAVCIIDPEGDYASLGELHGVQRLGEPGKCPDIAQIRRLITHHFGSVIVDLSLLDSCEHATCTKELLEQLSEDREATGLPHWIVIDEAHHTLDLPGKMVTALAGGQKGYCLITYQPTVFAKQLDGSIDIMLALPGGKRTPGADPLEETGRLCGLDVPSLLDSASQGQAAVIRPGATSACQLISLSARRTAHVRHWHKYLSARLPPKHRFIFRLSGETGGTVAANVQEFRDVLGSTSKEVVFGHALRRDFSRWIADVLQDATLADALRLLEEKLIGSNQAAEDIRSFRDNAVKAIGERYVD